MPPEVSVQWPALFHTALYFPWVRGRDGTQAFIVQSWARERPSDQRTEPSLGDLALCPYSPAYQGGRPASPAQMMPLASLWAPSLWRPHLTGKASKLWVLKVLWTLPLVVKIHCSCMCVHVWGKNWKEIHQQINSDHFRDMWFIFCPLKFSMFSKFSTMSLRYLYN